MPGFVDNPIPTWIEYIIYTMIVLGLFSLVSILRAEKFFKGDK